MRTGRNWSRARGHLDAELQAVTKPLASPKLEEPALALDLNVA